jgi:hypothetical protein
MHTRFRRATALLALVALTSSACSDLVTAPGHPAPQRIAAAAAPSYFAAAAAATQGTFVCSMTSADPVGPRAYRQSRIQLRFPASALHMDGKLRRLTYRGYSEGSKLNRLLVCEIPASAAAASIASIRLGITSGVPSGGKPVSRTGDAVILNETDTPVVLDPVTVTAWPVRRRVSCLQPGPIESSQLPERLLALRRMRGRRIVGLGSRRWRQRTGRWHLH